ncbi:hypothetical protein F4677DRAFT_440751 [Hypoxylon crocopeplum]|nr:hypothetical protein F4677DRAFT_440751 [Hypoxylon crocopeplum]
MAPTSHYHGSLIAFEGPQDIISTQLRLLPNSPNILIIPPLRHFVKEESLKTPFDARTSILKVHKACSRRAETAREFLRDSTPGNKRLVFMNGGTSSAQVECVTDITKHLTNGDFAKAERIFNELIRNGVAGLYHRQKMEINPKSSQTNRRPNLQDEQSFGDPTSEAMKAADALDFETASLQSNTEIDLMAMARPRSSSVPPYMMVDDFQSAPPFYVFGACKWQRRSAPDGDLLQSPRRSYTTKDPRKVTWQTQDKEEPRMFKLNGKPNAPACVSVGKGGFKNQLSPAHLDLSSPHTLGIDSMPATPAICEAFAVDMRSSASPAPDKKIKSVDRTYSGAVRNQDVLLCSFPQPPRSRPQSFENGLANYQEKPTLRSKFASEIPRPTFSTPNRSVVRRSPPPPLKLRKLLQRPVTYVDRGTSPMNNYVDRSTITEPEPESEVSYKAHRTDVESCEFPGFENISESDYGEPHETVLPMLENLVVLFKTEATDTPLEATIQAFREGTYPISKSLSMSRIEVGGDPDRSNTQSQRHSRTTPLDRKVPMSDARHAEVAPARRVDADEYDPFAYGKYLRPPRTWHSKHNTTSRRPSTPPTPAQTPPLTARTPERCFHDFTTTDCRTAVCIQNSLRSILNIYFPPVDAGYQQFHFPLLPELSSLWKPVFREAETGTVIKRKRKVDLILAIGSQHGVEKEFLAAISGSLEKLGTKPNGVTRSGRLDLRFLIASAMQAFTSQPLANQTQDNPFSNPLLLATLIIPHLETYMAAHSVTRFLLLEYPPDHLTTVLALQRLVGVDLLKVAGIIDSDSDEPKLQQGFKVISRTNTQSRTNSKVGISKSNTRASATLLTPSGVKQIDIPSFSRANFLLTSSANESEIATMISTIWKILIDISPFYIPEGTAPRSSVLVGRESKRESKRESQGRPVVQTPLINPAQQYATLSNAAGMMGFQRQANASDSADPPPPIPSKRRGGESTRPEAPLKSSKGSISETIKSSTVKTMKSQRKKLRNMLGKETDAAVAPETASAHIDYWDDEDEDDFSAEERKYMPLYGKPNGPRKGNSRKALKWLGLAM